MHPVGLFEVDAQVAIVVGRDEVGLHARAIRAVAVTLGARLCSLILTRQRCSYLHIPWSGKIDRLDFRDVNLDAIAWCFDIGPIDEGRHVRIQVRLLVTVSLPRNLAAPASINCCERKIDRGAPASPTSSS